MKEVLYSLTCQQDILNALQRAWQLRNSNRYSSPYTEITVAIQHENLIQHSGYRRHLVRNLLKLSYLFVIKLSIHYTTDFPDTEPLTVKLSQKLTKLTIYRQSSTPEKLRALSQLLRLLDRRKLEQITWHHLEITNALRNFVGFLEKWPNLRSFNLFRCNFEGIGNGGPRAIAETLARLPRLQEICFDIDDCTFAAANTVHLLSQRQALQMAIIFCNSKSLKRLNLHHSSFPTWDPDGFQQLCLAVKCCESLEVLSFPQSQFSTKILTILANTLIPHNYTLQHLSLDLMQGACLDPIVEAVAESNNRLRTLNIGVYGVGNVVISEEILHKFLRSLRTRNYTLELFDVYKRYKLRPKQISLRPESQHIRAEICFYLMLNRNYRREQLLTDPKYTTEDLIQALSQLRCCTGRCSPKRLSIVYYLLSAKPELWLPPQTKNRI